MSEARRFETDMQVGPSSSYSSMGLSNPIPLLLLFSGNCVLVNSSSTSSSRYRSPPYNTPIEEELHDHRHIKCIGKQSGMPRDSTQHGCTLIMHITLQQLLPEDSYHFRWVRCLVYQIAVAAGNPSSADPWVYNTVRPQTLQKEHY